MQEEAKWYVIHTYSGYENMVKDSLERLVENNGLSERIFEIKIPLEQTVEEKNGKQKVIMRKRFPCYVFVKITYANDLWYLITSTRGVTGFVGPNGRPIPLQDDEVKKMQLETKVAESNLSVGDDVKVVAGPFEGFIGKITQLENENQKALVSVSMFGRETEVNFEFVQIEKIENLK